MILLSRRIFVAIRRLSFARIKGFAITRRPAASGDHYWVVSAARWAWDETASYAIDRAYWCRWRGRQGRPEVDGVSDIIEAGRVGRLGGRVGGTNGPFDTTGLILI
jgi:hypothetical protein